MTTCSSMKVNDRRTFLRKCFAMLGFAAARFKELGASGGRTLQAEQQSVLPPRPCRTSQVADSEFRMRTALHIRHETALRQSHHPMPEQLSDRDESALSN